VRAVAHSAAQAASLVLFGPVAQLHGWLLSSHTSCGSRFAAITVTYTLSVCQGSHSVDQG
jgi:hypothetical protein